ncbi:MAG: hypothetical protein LUH22_09045 [Bacteroides sp.]|nr:hypothetical protein [Bacteroides sp.]
MSQIVIWESSYGSETYRDGSYGQFSGNLYSIKIVVAALVDDFDSEIKEIYFKGDGEYKVQADQFEKKVATGYWTFKFRIARRIMGQKIDEEFKGKYYFVTEKGTMYTFDQEGQEFIYNVQTFLEGFDKMKNEL